MKKRIDREQVRQLIAEEVAHWDAIDTSGAMEKETEWFTFEWTEREDRCDRRAAAASRGREMDGTEWMWHKQCTSEERELDSVDPKLLPLDHSPAGQTRTVVRFEYKNSSTNHDKYLYSA